MESQNLKWAQSELARTKQTKGKKGGKSPRKNLKTKAKANSNSGGRRGNGGGSGGGRRGNNGGNGGSSGGGGRGNGGGNGGNGGKKGGKGNGGGKGGGKGNDRGNNNRKNDRSKKNKSDETNNTNNQNESSDDQDDLTESTDSIRTDVSAINEFDPNDLYKSNEQDNQLSVWDVQNLHKETENGKWRLRKNNNTPEHEKSDRNLVKARNHVFKVQHSMYSFTPLSERLRIRFIKSERCRVCLLSPCFYTHHVCF